MKEYTDDTVIFELKLSWLFYFEIVGQVTFFSILVLIALNREQNLFGQFIFIANSLIGILVAIQLALNIFFLLRGSWVLRVTPAGLIVRFRTKNVAIPWSSIEEVYLLTRKTTKEKRFGATILDLTRLNPAVIRYKNIEVDNEKVISIFIFRDKTHLKPSVLVEKLEDYLKEFQNAAK